MISCIDVGNHYGPQIERANDDWAVRKGPDHTCT